MTRRSALIWVLAVVVATLAMGSGSGETTAPAGAGKDEVVKLKTLIPSNGAINRPIGNSTPNLVNMNAKFRELFNAELDVEVGMSEKMQEIVNTRLASGNLPDIINFRFSDVRLVEVYRSGLIVSLNKLVDQYAPDIKKWLYVESPYIALANSDSDGNLLRVPYLVANLSHKISLCHIRNDWLTKLGLAVPETPDQLYEVLKAFRARDANGNGAQDEIVLALGIANFNRAISSGFGVRYMTDAANSFYFRKDGTVYNTMVTPEARQYFQYMAKLSRDGILDPVNFNITGELFNERLYQNRVGMQPSSYWQSVLNNVSMNSRGIVGGEFVPMEPLKTASGEQFSVVSELGGSGGFMITKACKAPDRAMKIFNWGVTVEGSQFSYYGTNVENEYFRRPTAEELMGLKYPDYGFMTKPLLSQKVKENPMFWEEMGWKHGFVPQRLVADWGIVAFNCATSWDRKVTLLAGDVARNSRILVTFQDKTAIPPLLTTMPTSAEVGVISECADLFVYMDEMTSKFMTGVESLDKWDAFVAQCEKLGLSKVAKVKQDQYQRYLAWQAKNK